MRGVEAHVNSNGPDLLGLLAVCSHLDVHGEPLPLPAGWAIASTSIPTELDNQWLRVSRGEGSGSIIAVRGTVATLKSMAEDAMIRLVPWPGGGSVHEGFLTGMRDLWPDIHQHGQDLDGPVIMTGHSQGAAIATILGAWLQHAGILVSVYGFGSPRPGDAAFARAVSAVPITQIRNPHDWVTHVPLTIEGVADYTQAGSILTLPGEPLPASLDVFAEHHCARYHALLAELASRPATA